ncbi:restriction endonuclease subunit S [Ligilactobacillus salivarius]|nr:restriction endonuclease subunit S [Ligilactobacillus salivarius]
MENKKSSVPKLRFPGFTGAWEQRKFDEIFKSISDKGYPELPVISASQELGMIFRDSSGYDIKHNKKSEVGYKRVQSGDFVIHLRSFQGGFAASEIEGITSPAYTIIRFKVNNQDFYFWKYVFTSKKFIDSLVKVTYGIRDGRSISYTDFKNLKWLIPSKKEQQQIGAWFEKFDSLIALHQRKLEHLKEQKKGLLQKMFPKNGEVVPEVRFPGFTDDWEQRKLGEVASYRNGKAHEKDISESGKYIVINSKFVSSNGTVRKYSNKMIAPLNKGEISFVLSDVPNGKALARTFLTDQDDTYTLNQRIAGILPKQGVNPYFMSTLMNRNSYFLKFNDGVGQTNLSKRDVTEWKAFYPSHAEQKKIGGFLQQFDSLIALHQRKLEHLKLMKKGLLQQMFV